MRADTVAGLTTAAVVIPKAMAYAAIAGLPLEAGLYTALVPPLIYAAMGTSRPLSVTTTSTLSILTAGVLVQFAPGAAPQELIATAAALSLMTGVVYGRSHQEVEEKVRRRTSSRFNPQELRERGILVGLGGQIAEQIYKLAESRVETVMLQWLELDNISGLESMAKELLR